MKHIEMEIAIIALSVAVLGAVILLGFMYNNNSMGVQAIKQLHTEVDSLQEKRIEEIREHAEANKRALEKLTQAAAMHSASSHAISESSHAISAKIEEAIEVMNGNQYAILMKLDKINGK